MADVTGLKMTFDLKCVTLKHSIHEKNRFLTSENIEKVVLCMSLVIASEMSKLQKETYPQVHEFAEQWNISPNYVGNKCYKIVIV